MRSKRTSELGLIPKRPVKILALSVRTLSGTPWLRMASENASETGLAVARATTLAEVQNREWSSRPVTTEASVPSSIFTPPTTSICHSSIARERSQRL
jgi:hypothetical protein